MSPASDWGRRAGLLGLAAGLASAGAAAGVAAERRAVARRLRRDEPGPELVPHVPTEELAVVAGDGVPLHVEVDVHEGAAHPDLTVVLVHGYALSLECWWYQRRDLDAGRVVLYDQRGHGRSGRGDPARATIEQLGDDLHRVLAQTVPEGPVLLVGHSMGGMTVMALADQHPELFDGRVVGVGLLSTSPGRMAEVTFGIPSAGARLLRRVAPPVFAQLAKRPAFVARGRQVGSDVELLLTKRWSFGSDVPASLVEYVSRMIAQTPIETVADFWPAFDDHDKLHALAVLDDVPVLVLVGDEDLLTPAEHSRQIAAALPHAELVVVPDAGHLVLLEHPGTVNAHLRDLVARATAGDAGSSRDRAVGG
ncbi:MAG TPA: alpha/beta hydrolase [Motilibacteraceae bacterium]|nr:alpha/beta hydrolase [Motilibacteraceae bacterium]